MTVHSAELLAGERATALFRAMRNSDERNFFICDLPPVFANDDASIIMESLDGYVIVAAGREDNGSARSKPPPTCSAMSASQASCSTNTGVA